MQRRNLLKSLTLGMGTVLTLPSWANSWHVDTLSAITNFTDAEDSLLAEIVATIIPETDTPGAKSLGVHKLIQKIVTDCQGPVAEQKFKANLKKLNEFAKSNQDDTFIKLSAEKKLETLTQMEKSQVAEIKNFARELKRMTIDGYLKSEYVMTNITHYEWAPARYHGCVAV